MRCHDSPSTPELEALLERGRAIPVVPDVVRARALTRARAIMAGAAAAPHEPTPIARRRGRALALAASVALIVGAAGAVAALRDTVFGTETAPTTAKRTVAPRTVARAAPASAAPVVAAQDTSAQSPPQRPGRAATAQAFYAAELSLLSRAQVAYASGDFDHVLTLAAEHARRFPNGRLTEEREALRVRSLAKSGRTDEARRATAAFAERFPRSVLLRR